MSTAGGVGGYEWTAVSELDVTVSIDDFALPPTDDWAGVWIDWYRGENNVRQGNHKAPSA